MTPDPTRANARAAGLFYLLTFAASFPALALLQPVLTEPSFILGTGSAGQVRLGLLLDVVNAFACVGTAVAVYPVVRRQNTSVALGFVTSRLVEAGIILVGVLSLLAVVTLRDEPGAADATTLTTVGQALVAVRDWTFLLGPAVMASINAGLFGWLLYRSGLVPRAIPALGLAGAPLLLASALATYAGVIDQVSVWSGVATIPVALWELSVGLWMTFRGFRPAAVAGLATAAG
ncbi:MAG: DUF4386 domain-containing protein [Nocardioidaceae bacterium]